MSDTIEIPHFVDLIDTPHLIDDRERLPGPDGTPGLGMKISEAVTLAEHWWETKARFSMPDFGKTYEQVVVKSGVLRGLPWSNLSKKEMLRVLAQWYAHVGVRLIVEGRSTSSDAATALLMQDLREQGAKLFKVLDDSGTHTKTDKATDDKVETETWKEGYEEIAAESQLVDAQGNKLKRGDA